MFEDPENEPAEDAGEPAQMAQEKVTELRMHAELAAVFEAHRKFDAQLLSDLDQNDARELQRSMGRLEKARSPEHPVLPEGMIDEALRVLNHPAAHLLATNDYHIARRPGETMIARWLAGAQVDQFYTRLQAHFDAGLEGLREDERQAKAWKQDPKTLKYLDALDAVKLKMEQVYLRDFIRAGKLAILSTQTADEINIAYLCDHIMGVSPAQVVGSAPAPPDAPTERDLPWFYKLFSLRGMEGATERMCFFMFLQKSDEF